MQTEQRATTKIRVNLTQVFDHPSHPVVSLDKLTSSQRTYGRRTRYTAQRVSPVPAKAVHAEDAVPRKGVDDLGFADSLVGDDGDPQGLADFAAEIRYL